MLSSKIENTHWAEKTTTTRCGIWETATMRNTLWLFLNNRNVLWHVKICHDVKVVSWLLKEVTTMLDFMKIPQVVVVVTFYSHDAMWDKFQPAKRSVSFNLVSKWSNCKLVFFTAISVDSVKKIFNDKVKELNDASSHRSLFLDNERCNNIVWEVKEAQIWRKNNQPLTLKHYQRFKRYDVMKIGDMQNFLKWFRRKWWFKHLLLLQDGGAVWCLGNSTCQHRTQKDKR